MANPDSLKKKLYIVMIAQLLQLASLILEEKIRHSFEQLPGNGGCCWQKRGRDFLSGGQVTRVYRREQGNSGIRRRSRVYFDI